MMIMIMIMIIIIIIIVDISNGETYIRNSDSWEVSTMECNKSWDSNPMVRTGEGSTVERSKSQESYPVVRRVIYAKILIRKILPN